MNVYSGLTRVKSLKILMRDKVQQYKKLDIPEVVPLAEDVHEVLMELNRRLREVERQLEWYERERRKEGRMGMVETRKQVSLARLMESKKRRGVK